MNTNLNNIFDSISHDISSILDKKHYANNADKTDSTASNNHEALRQVWAGSIKKVDCDYLYSISKNIKISNYLEIGSYVGISLRIINEIFNPDKLYSIDPNIPHRVFLQPRTIFKTTNKHILDKIHMIDGYWVSGGDPTINAEYFQNLNLQFDLIFIDAIHTYDSVKQDFFEAIKILSDDGMILFHDIYSWPEVNKFIVELQSNTDFITDLSPRTQKTIDGFATVRINHAKNH